MNLGIAVDVEIHKFFNLIDQNSKNPTRNIDKIIEPAKMCNVSILDYKIETTWDVPRVDGKVTYIDKQGETIKAQCTLSYMDGEHETEVFFYPIFIYDCSGELITIRMGDGTEFRKKG